MNDTGLMQDPEQSDDEALEALATWSFAVAMSTLERSIPGHPPIGETGAPQAERVFLRANRTLGFPPEEVAAILRRPGSDDAYDVVVNLFGLFGPSSPMPAHISERVIHAEEEGALGDFLDFFNHRLIGLLYRTWKHYKHHMRYEPGATDTISSAIVALFGWHPVPAEADVPSRNVLLPYAGLLSLGSRSAAIVSGIASHTLGLRCRIEEFVERQIRIPESETWVFGAGEYVLGETTIIGEFVADAAGQFRIHVGPVNHDTFLKLLPGEEMYQRLQTIVALAVRDPLTWDVEVELLPGEAPDMCLGSSRLGWTSFAAPNPALPTFVRFT
jgi:type VI secretion system protein ImpH